MFFDDDFGYDRAFDYDGDGEMDPFERMEALDFYTSSNTDEEEEEDDDLEYSLALNGLDVDELENMDEEERREALEDAGLDPDDYDFD